MSVSARLRQLRLVKGMTQEEVAGQIGVTRQTISGYESGRTKPDVDMLVRLADVYGTDFEEILCGQGRALRSVRRVRAAAAVVAGILTVLTMLSSAFLWSANHFFFH
ncbi:helix-turn-helix domain-containing protein [Dysosmobacter sp.]